MSCRSTKYKKNCRDQKSGLSKAHFKDTAVFLYEQIIEQRITWRELMTSSLEKETGKRSYVHHSFADRKRVVTLYESGLGSKKIARITGLDDAMIRQWLRRYRRFGLEALQLTRVGGRKNVPALRKAARAQKDLRYTEAFRVYATTLVPTASIARRYQLDYRTFKYHIEHHHPELVAERSQLREIQ